MRVPAACRWLVRCTSQPEAKARASDGEKDGSFDFDWKSEPKESDTYPRGPAVGGGAHRSRWRFARRGRRVPILVSLSSPCRSFGWQRWLPSRLPCSDCEVKCKRRMRRESMAMRWSDAVASPSASSRWWSRFHVGAAVFCRANGCWAKCLTNENPKVEL